ncbi:cell surface protein [Tenacibaculum maritimum]|nr:cell surface protein [Tenacibaculum maritimum]MDB0603225.1 cell surface protein [Tenacibaculum maritimum]MDB0610487.1 cell surface protein [Tenacibaculum maritimum]
MKITKLILKLFIISLVFTSCSSDNNDLPQSLGSYDNGIIVSAEGNFGNKDGSISYIDEDLNSLARTFIYTGVNNSQLGGLIQSITFSDTDAYIILNDANTIVVVDRYTFKKKSEIKTGLKNPRYMAISNGKGYITNWGDGATTTDDYVAVLDLSTNTLETGTISLDNGVERILAKDNKLYVSHLGAYSSNNIISIIDLATNNAVTKVTVKDNPDEIFFDNQGNLVVLSEGKPLTYNADYTSVLTSTTSAISFINLATAEVVKELQFAENKRSTKMYIANGKIYYYSPSEEKVYQIEENATELAKEGVEVGKIYGMAVKNNDLYTVEYAFKSLSKLSVIDLITKEEKYGTAVGLGASKIYFN